MDGGEPRRIGTATRVGLGVGTAGILFAGFFLGGSAPEGPLQVVTLASPLVGLLSIVFLGGGLHDLMWRPPRGVSLPAIVRGLATVAATLVAFNVLLRFGLVFALLVRGGGG